MHHNRGTSSPVGKSVHHAYNTLIQEIGRFLKIEIQPRSAEWSPQKSTRSVSDDIHNVVNFLFFQNPDHLQRLISTWKIEAPKIPGTDKRVDRFLAELRVVAESSRRKQSIKQPNFTPKNSETRRRSTTELQSFADEARSPTSKILTPSSSATTTTSSRSQQSFNSGGSSVAAALPETAKTSFASVFEEPHDSTQYGSSWGQATQDELHKTYTATTAPATPNAPNPSNARASISPPARVKRTAAQAHSFRDNGQVQRPGSVLHAAAEHSVDQKGSKRPRLEGKANERPTPVTHQIRNFPSSGFGIDDSKVKLTLPDPRAWDMLRQHQASSKLKSKGIQKFEPSTICTDNLLALAPTLTGSMYFNNDGDEHLMSLHPNRIGLERACRAQRRYGWDRFLYICISLNKGLPSHLGSEKKQLDLSFKKWVLRPHTLLGRTWRAFHLQENKPKKGRRPDKDHLDWRVVFFATDGQGLKSVPLHDFLLSWSIPTIFNADQKACKAYSRIELALSRTTATIRFEPEQIKLIEDLKPTSVIDHDTYLDKTYQVKHRKLRAYNAEEAMTDGCARISVGAAKLVCESLGLDVSHGLPTAFQARIFGSKGVWYISAGYDTEDPIHLDPWIEIRESQMKVKHCLDPLQLATLYRQDDTLTSFDVVKYSHVPKTSELHRDFLPILESRGVPRRAVMDLAVESLKDETETLLQAIHEPICYARLLQRHAKDRSYTTNIETGDLPRGSAERLLLFLLLGGFMPDAQKFVAEEFLRLCASIKIRGLQQIRIPCDESIMLLGIADDTGLVPAGKVHVTFSEGLSNGVNSQKLVNLGNKKILIARDPTLRESDIQKYDCIFEPKLAHLKDVVVFSSQGSMPGAAKHQGGDYDGDMFWVCWHEPFTFSFKNAPVLEPKTATQLGITTDTTRLKDFAPPDGTVNEEYVDGFLMHTFDFKYRPSFLGRVTNQAYAVSYSTNNLSSENSLDLYDLHDHLNDEAKNGFTFAKESHASFSTSRGLHVGRKDPDYKASILELTQAVTRAEDQMKVILGACQKRCKGSYSNILDELYFNVLLDQAGQSLQEIKTHLEHVPTRDQELEWPFSRLVAETTDKVAVRELERNTAAQLQKVSDDWSRVWSKRPTLCLEDWHQNYRDIKPTRPFEWAEIPPAPQAPTNWDCYRASIMFRKHHRRARPVFWVAWVALCHIKKHSNTGWKVLSIIEPHLKVRRPKIQMKDKELPELLNIETTEDEFDNIDSLFDPSDWLTDSDLDKMEL